MTLETALAEVRAAHTELSTARQNAEKAKQHRDRAVRKAHTLGASYGIIADVLGVQRQYVYEICTKEE